MYSPSSSGEEKALGAFWVFVGAVGLWALSKLGFAEGEFLFLAFLKGF